MLHMENMSIKPISQHHSMRDYLATSKVGQEWPASRLRQASWNDIKPRKVVDPEDLIP